MNTQTLEFNGARVQNKLLHKPLLLYLF